MVFKRIVPGDKLIPYVLEYWIFEHNEQRIAKQKIIPDGYFEIIFHYGNLYQINLHGKWEIQNRSLFAGQIDTHFFLKNTGDSGMIGIKLKPVTPALLFAEPMHQYVNKVVNLLIFNTVDKKIINEICRINVSQVQRIELIEEWFLNLLNSNNKAFPFRLQNALNRLFEMNGLLEIEDLAKHMHISKRQMQRDFKHYIGLSPKKYARILRFNYIFQLLQEKNMKWVDVAIQSGYFDQAHFIKNFKEFTGEEPSTYGFDENNMANFFLKKN